MSNPSTRESADSVPSPDERWWHGAVVYENHLPSLRDGNGDGIGDLEGLIESLDYLSDVLGVDAVWVGPFYRSPLLDGGYDVVDHCAVEPRFGDLATFDRLVEEAHRRGLRVLVDYIPNHTSHDHPWFIESRSSRDNACHDWYVWRDPAPGGSLPNNWTSEAGGSVWEWDPGRAQYYLHSHLIEQPDLNWRNPHVRAAMLDVLRFWLERGADGFRVDVAHMLMKHPDLPDNPPANDVSGNPFDLQHPDYASQLHIHDRRHPDTGEALAEIRRVLDEFPHTVAIAEIEAMPWDEWAGYYGHGGTGIHLPFPFRIIETSWAAPELARELRDMYLALPDGCWPIIALGNHDRSRLASRLGQSQARVAAMLLLTLRATPCLFYGDELGYEDQPVAIDRQRDYFARAAGGVSRDPVRTPMAWNDGHNGGFSAASADCTWLPIAADYATRNVEVQLHDPDSLLTLYRDLLILRAQQPALQFGAIELIDTGTPGLLDSPVVAYRRTLHESSLTIVLNLTSSEQPAPPGVGGHLVFSTDPDERGTSLAPGAPIQPDRGLILQVDREA